MGDFLKTWYGLALFIAFDAAAVIAVIAIGYKWLFKRLLDILASLACMIVLSPVFLTVFVRGKLFQRRTGAMRSLIDREFYVGKKAKTIALHVFRSTDDDGDEAGKYGKWLKRTRLYKLPYVFDVFCGRLSFVGVKKLSFADAAFVAEADEGRYSVRPGFINPLAATGNKDTDYKEMFLSDSLYAQKLGLFGDVKIFFVWLLKKIRGEKSADWLGLTASKTYAETLLEEESITREDFDTVAENAAAEEAELRKKYGPKEETEEGPAEKDGVGDGEEEAQGEENEQARR